MTVDKFDRTPRSQNVTNVGEVSHEYLNNFLWKGQATDMNQNAISNLGLPQGPNDAVKRQYGNEKFIRRDAPIDMKQKPIKNASGWRRWCGDKGLLWHEILTSGWEYAGWDCDVWKQDFTLGWTWAEQRCTQT